MKKIQLFLITALAALFTACPAPDINSQPTIQSLIANPSALPIGGGQSTLTWQISNASSVSMDQGIGSVTGNSKVISVNSTTTYVLTATNTFGSVTSSVTVSVAQPVEPPANQIASTLNPWTRGERTLRGRIVANGTLLATAVGTIGQTGILDLRLPDTVPNAAAIFTAPANCSSSVILSPADIKGATLTVEVTTANNILSGTLYRATSNIFNGSSQIGSRQIQYLYADKVGTWKGTCVNNGQTRVIDVTFKQGWNLLTLESVSPTSFRIATDAVTPVANWRFSPSGTIRIDNQNPDLEVGDTATLTAIAEDGYQYAGSDLDWSSESPAIIEVNSNGVVNAKNIGGSQITAQLKELPTTRASTLVSVSQIAAQGSTYNLEDQTTGTAFRMQFLNTRGDSGQDIPVKITGPNGWNNNQPFDTTIKSAIAGFWTVVTTQIPAISGTYTVRRSTKTQGGTTFIIDASQKLPIAKNLTLYNSYSNAPSVRWEAPILNPSSPYDYYTEILDNATGDIVRSKSLASSMGMEFSGVNFDTTRTYRIRVYIQSTTYNSNESFLGVSMTSILLDFRPIINQIYIRGGKITGGNSVTIIGAYFDLNTRVFFGNNEVTSKTFTDTTSITVVVPAGSAGTVDITLQNARGITSPSNLTKYTYYSINEFIANSPQKLLKGNNGFIYFIESGTTQNAFALQLSRISAATSVTRIDLPSTDSSDLRDLTLDSTGNIWVAFGTKLVKVTPSNVITEIPLPAGVKPAALAFGADGNIWISRTDSYKITRIQPDGTSATEFVVPNSNFGSGSFSVGNKFVLAADSNLWFTQNSAGIGRITATGAITIISNLFPANNSIISYNNAIWLSNSFAGITRVAYDGTITNIGSCGGSGLAVGKDGYFWCGQNFATSGGVITRRIITATSSNVPAEGISVTNTNSAQISDVMNDSDGNIWFIINGKIAVLNL